MEEDGVLDGEDTFAYWGMEIKSESIRKHYKIRKSRCQNRRKAGCINGTARFSFGFRLKKLNLRLWRKLFSIKFETEHLVC